MKVFLSWSGPETREFASFLRDWLEGVIQAVKPWMSEKDIAKGRHSMAELRAQLTGTRLGIVVLTSANQGSRWINFEAGAISNSVGETAVVPLLLDLGKTDVVGPLSQFQAVDATARAEVHQMLKDINDAQGEPLPERVLARAFDHGWPAFEEAVRRFREQAQVAAASVDAAAVPVRDERDVLAEILETVRALDRQGHATRALLSGLAAPLSSRPAAEDAPPLPEGAFAGPVAHRQPSAYDSAAARWERTRSEPTRRGWGPIRAARPEPTDEAPDPDRPDNG
ncbi:toll/interleukin-1 receptor domain-containing protein [Saccharothrix lopnurensis]|uniref:Toll/interleukin-1 receptor domain-containing protein n=1 Tax=Saccharothrix lopnurensis TaxID=1670621 RepID=A0ABW1P3K8_9PSEU